MAQRTIHYLFGELLSGQIKLKDKRRFLLGSILPDAAIARDRDKAHFKVQMASHVYYDFKMFRNSYCDLIPQDDLYLGYYMHLVEDAFYRKFIYSDRFRMPGTREEVGILHNDYRILNSHIVGKYGIHNALTGGINIAHESICSIAAFAMREFLDDMSSDFTEQMPGTTVFLTENMLDEFIETYIPLAADEILSARTGTSILHASDYAWLKKR